MCKVFHVLQPRSYSSSEMGVNTKLNKLPLYTRSRSIDEEMYDEVILDVVSLKTTLVELQHYLIGVSI